MTSSSTQNSTRYYRQGIHLLRDGRDSSGKDDDDDDDEKKAEKGKGKEVDRLPPIRRGQDDTGNTHLAPSGDINCMLTLGSIRSRISKVSKRKKAQNPESPSRPDGSVSGRPPRY